MALPKFPDLAYPNPITITPRRYVKSDQGAWNPVDGASAAYPASVQPLGTTREVRNGESVTVTRYDVFIKCVATDAFPPTIARGASLSWGARTLSVIGPAQDRGGYGVSYWFQCEAVE